MVDEFNVSSSVVLEFSDIIIGVGMVYYKFSMMRNTIELRLFYLILFSGSYIFITVDCDQTTEDLQVASKSNKQYCKLNTKQTSNLCHNVDNVLL